MAAPVKEGGLCSQIWNSTLKGGAAAAFWAFAARATATRCSGEWSGLLGAATASSLDEDNSWRSLATAVAVACVWAFFCVVAALLFLTAARPSFGSSARRLTSNRRLAGVLLASTARIAAAGPANASVAPFSGDFSRTQRKLSGYVFAEHVPTEFENDMHYLQDAAGEEVEPLVEEGGGGHDGHDHGRRRLDDGVSGIMTDSNIKSAVAAWLSNSASAEATYGHISTWETSRVTDMSALFCAASGYSQCNTAAASFNEDIGAWDTSGVKTMNAMFIFASAFDQDIGGWAVHSVRDMYGMFRGASSFDQDISGWAVHSVTSMAYMFRDASSFNQDIGGWALDSVVDMTRMFDNEDYGSAFDQDLGWCVDYGVDFDSDDNDDTLKDAFDGTWCASTSCGVVQSSNCPTPVPTPRPVPNPNPGPTPRPVPQPTPRPAPAPTIAPLVADDTTIRTAVGVWLSDATAAEATYGHISTWETGGVTDMSNLFCGSAALTEQGCNTAAASFNEDIGAWDTSGVTRMYGMFWYASSFNQNIGSWSVENVNEMGHMFTSASAFDEDIGAWDTSGVTSMVAMFHDADSFNQDISGWRVDKVTTMQGMFANTQAFNNPLGSWQVHNVVEMQEMFYYASAFNQDISGWAVHSVTNMLAIFNGASAFDQDLGWCVDDGVDLRYAFDDPPCASTSCGVVQVADVADCPTPNPTSPTPRPTPAPTPATSDAVEGSFTCAGITLADAEAHAPVYAAAVAKVYNVDASKVIVTFSSGRRRLQSGSDVVVDYIILYDSPAAAAAAVASVASYTAAVFDTAVQTAAADAGVSSVFAGATVEAVATPVATQTTPPPSPLPPSSSGGGGGGGGGGGLVVIIAVVAVVLILVAVGAAYYYKTKKKDKGTKVAPATKASSSTVAAVAVGAAAGAGAALTASQIDILGPLSGILSALPAAAPPPLNMCLMPFTSALAELGLAVRQVRFNKEAAALLQRRGVEIAQKLQDVVKATQGLPTGQVEAVARTVTAIGQALDEAAKFLQHFSKKGAFKKLCSGSLDARRFGLLDKRLCELSTELGSALDLQQLALQAQRFEKIEGLIQLLGQQTVDANNQAAAQRAAIMCGIEKGSAVESEELSALGLKLDQIAADVSTVIDQNAHQQESLDEVKEMVAAKNSKLRGRALARQDKDRALEELEIELDSVEEKPIAQGAQGAVYKASYQGDVVALKKMSLAGVTATKRNKMMRDFATELAIMVKLRSPRIVQVFGVVTTDTSWLGLVVEYCGGGDLREALDADDAASIDEAQRRSWLSDISMGMAYLYSKGVEHRDLKSLNVLLDGGRRCKVTDFGLSKSESLATAATQATAGGDAKGTPAYMAPELLDSNTFTEKTDVYAYGMIVFEVLTGDNPWRGLNQMQIMMQVCIKKERPTIDVDAPADLVALMRRCWDHEPDARPTFAAIKMELRGGPDTPAR